MSDPVRVERHGPVTTVILNRPEARNAVNGPTAAGLFEAFEEFERDDTASVAVLWGDNGTFCAGADLKAFGTSEANAVHRTGPGPMGPTRMALSKPVIAAVSGYAVAGGLELATAATKPRICDRGGRMALTFQKIEPNSAVARSMTRPSIAAAAMRRESGAACSGTSIPGRRWTPLGSAASMVIPPSAGGGGTISGASRMRGGAITGPASSL